MSKHTPGPWSPPQEPNGKGMGWRAGPCWLGQNSHSEETAANARLVAAAPDILAALVSAKEALDNCPWSDTVFDADDIRLKVESAIAKATGSES